MEQPRPIEARELQHDPLREYFVAAPAHIQEAILHSNRELLMKERNAYAAQIFPEAHLEPREYRSKTGESEWGTRIRIPVPTPDQMLTLPQDERRRAFELEAAKVTDPISEHNMQVSELFLHKQSIRQPVPEQQTLFNIRVAYSSVYEWINQQTQEREFGGRINNDFGRNIYAGKINPLSELVCFAPRNSTAGNLWRATPGELIPVVDGVVQWPEGFWGPTNKQHGAAHEYKTNVLGIYGIDALEDGQSFESESVDFKPVHYPTRTSVVLDYSAWGKTRLEELFGVYALITPNTIEIVKPIEIPEPTVLHDGLYQSMAVRGSVQELAEWGYRRHIENRPADFPYTAIYDGSTGQEVTDPATLDEMRGLEASPPWINYVNMIYSHYNRELNQ